MYLAYVIYKWIDIIVFDSLFSWNIGPAHIISISTEVYYFYQYGIEQIVQQYEWLEKDLQVRKITSSKFFVYASIDGFCVQNSGHCA